MTQKLQLQVHLAFSTVLLYQYKDEIIKSISSTFDFVATSQFENCDITQVEQLEKI